MASSSFDTCSGWFYRRQLVSVKALQTNFLTSRINSARRRGVVPSDHLNSSSRLRKLIN